MSHILEDFQSFLDTSPTSWHAVSQIGMRLAMQDFQPLHEEEKWDLKPGKKYFVIRGGTLLAFALPRNKPKSLTLVAAHTDSPGLRLKPKPQMQQENMTLFGTEVYGSPLLSSWLNRDLGIAGRLSVTDSQGNMEEKLVFIDDAPLVIPQLAVHLDREVNDKGLVLNKQHHLSPLVGLDLSSENALETLLRRHVSFHTLLAFDLFLVPLEKSRFLGSHSEMLAARGLDNLASAHALAAAFTLAHEGVVHQDKLTLAVFWDHEEIGSQTQEGASSVFLSDFLKRLALLSSVNEEELMMMKSRSLCVSVDMAQALNPNYVDKHDPNHRPLLGKGVVMKSNANQRYATNAPAMGRLIHLCQRFNLPYQHFVNRSDILCGTTVGPLMAQSLGIPTVDIGCPQLSMHAIREVMSCQDYLTLCTLLTHLLQEPQHE